MPADLRPAYADTARGLLHYAEAGTSAGEPLLLLHATPGSWRAFRSLMPLLAQDFRTIALDTPGYGNSDPLAGEVTVDAMADSVVALLDTLGLERAHLLGLHTGNKIAASLAARFPDRVGRVVLAGHTHSLIVSRQARDAAIHHLVDHYFPRFGSDPGGAHRVREWLMVQADLQPLWWPPHLLQGGPVEAADVATAESMVIDHLLGWRAIVPTYEAIFRFDLEAAMRSIVAPTLVLELRPRDEQGMPAQAPEICGVIPGSASATLPDCDASVFRHNPQRVAAAVLPFLAA